MKVYRFVIITMLLFLSASFLFAGGQAEPAPEAARPAAAVEGNEAPILAEMVQRGELPPLDERLPAEPMVVEVVDQIGSYGGTIHRTYLNPADGLAYGRLVWDPLVRYSMDGQEIIPNFAKDWDISADGRTYTFYLREGLKWSDGAPATADDVVFWFEDIVKNTEIYPAPPAWLVVDGQLANLVKVDDYAVRFEFVSAYPMFLRELAFQGVGSPGIISPAHYLKQFHAEYADRDELRATAQSAGFEVWTDLFGVKASYWENPDLPVTSAWKLTNEPGASRLIAERNPYFYKVDPAGNQLPYADRVVHDMIENRELVLLRAANGEIDMQFRHFQFGDFTLLKENEAAGNYTVFTHAGDRAADVAFWPNMSHDDPVYNELMNNTEFKRALSLAMDRDEINELFYFGLAEPRAITAISSEPTYEEASAQRHIGYDRAEANAILDGIGFDKRDSNGIRLGPDGKPIFFTLFYATAWPIHGEVAAVVKDHWQAIGIDSLVRPLERSVFYQMSYNNEIPLTVFTSPGTSLGNNWWIFPRGAHNSYAYGRWYATKGAEGKEPPEGSTIRRAMDLYDEAMRSPNFEDVVEATKQILRWGTEEVWGIGTVGEIPFIGVVHNRMGNVAREAPGGTHLYHPGNLYPEQWFIRN